MRLPGSTDTRVLLAGVVVFLALMAYLAVAFVTTHVAPVAAAPTNKTTAPWSPAASKLAPIPLSGDGYAVRVLPLARRSAGNYGALVQTIVPNPAPGRYVVSLGLKGTTPGRIGFEINEFRPGVAQYPLETTVPATTTWHRFTFRVRVKGTWLGLALYIYRPNQRGRTWFAIRDLKVA